MSGVAAEGKERYTEYNKDKADGKVDWAKEAKDASKDWRGQVAFEAESCLEAFVKDEQHFDWPLLS